MPAPIITSTGLTDYSINEGEQTTAWAVVINAPIEVVTITNNQSFYLTYNPTTLRYERIIYGSQIGVCGAKPIKFNASNALGIVQATDALTITVTAMTNYDIAGIETQLINILTTITDLKTKIAYEPKTIPELPAVTLFFDGFTQEQTETVAFTITYKWIMRLYVALNDAEKAQTELKSLVKQILSQLKLHMNFNDTVLFGMTPAGSAVAALDRSNPLLIMEFSLTATREED